MIKPKKNPVTKLVAAGVKAAAKVSASAAQKKNYKEHKEACNRFIAFQELQKSTIHFI